MHRYSNVDGYHWCVPVCDNDGSENERVEWIFHDPHCATQPTEYLQGKEPCPHEQNKRISPREIKARTPKEMSQLSWSGTARCACASSRQYGAIVDSTCGKCTHTHINTQQHANEVQRSYCYIEQWLGYCCRGLINVQIWRNLANKIPSQPHCQHQCCWTPPPNKSREAKHTSNVLFSEDKALGLTPWDRLMT